MGQAIVEELTSKLDIINSNKFGKFISQKCYVAVFKRSKEDWRKLIDKEGKVTEMFSEILGDEAKDVKKRKVEHLEKPAEVIPSKISKLGELSAVDDWLKDDPKPKAKKKKPKSKSYL